MVDCGVFLQFFHTNTGFIIKIDSSIHIVWGSTWLYTLYFAEHPIFIIIYLVFFRWNIVSYNTSVIYLFLFEGWKVFIWRKLSACCPPCNIGKYVAALLSSNKVYIINIKPIASHCAACTGGWVPMPVATIRKWFTSKRTFSPLCHICVSLFSLRRSYFLSLHGASIKYS